MKNKLILLTLLAMFSLTWAQAQEPKEYSSDEFANLITDLRSAEDGDVFVLTTPGDQGFYKIDTAALEIWADITIRAASGLSVKPKVKLVYNPDVQMVDYMVRLNATELDLTLYGIEFQGDSVNTKYGIRSGKISDLTEFFGYDDPNYDLRVIQSYTLNLFDCDINGITKGSDGRGIILYPGTQGTIYINNTTFSAINRDAINMYTDSGKTGVNGPWKYVDSLNVKNCTFYNIGREAINLRNSGELFVDNPAMECIINVDQCTFDACGMASVSDSYYPMRMDAPIIKITNSIFSNMESKSYIIGANENIESFLDYNVLWNVKEYNVEDEITEDFSSIKDAIDVLEDKVEPLDTVILGESITLNLYDPKYTDRDNADFTLGTDSDVLDKGSNGQPLGDLRWTPDYIPANNADLSDITINGESIADFSSDVTSYTVQLEDNTTDVPTVMPITLSSFASYEEEIPASLPGTFVFNVTSEDGFGNKTYEVFCFSNTVSAKSVIAQSLDIYPNPSNGKFNISNSKGSSLSIYNAIGSLLYQKEISSNKETLNTDLEKGVYFFIIENEKTQKTSKIIVE